MNRLLQLSVLFLNLSFLSFYGLGQTYEIDSEDGNSINTCAGTFYDSGGLGGDYTNGENYTVEFCSGNGDPITLSFSSINIEDGWDYLDFWDGADHLGFYTGDIGNGSVTAYSGCITVQFTSDGISGVGEGWEAEIECNSCLASRNMSPICSDESYSFENTVNVAEQIDPYDCGSWVNPSFFYMEVADPGDIEILIEQQNAGGTGLDVDFVMWGPYTTSEIACESMATDDGIQGGYAATATENANLGSPGGSELTVGLIFGCTAGEESSPPAAAVGEVYALMITNYSNQSGTITFEQTNFGAGGAGSTDCAVILGVSLQQFVGEYSDNKNVFTWRTLSEVNNDYFYLEYSTDGIIWQKIKQIDGHGTSNEEHIYTANHRGFEKGVNYYRLNQIDFDGSSTYSKIISIDNSKVEKKIKKVVNTLGQPVNESYSGLKIYIFEDGSIVKRL